MSALAKQDGVAGERAVEGSCNHIKACTASETKAWKIHMFGVLWK